MALVAAGSIVRGVEEINMGEAIESKNAVVLQFLSDHLQYNVISNLGTKRAIFHATVNSIYSDSTMKYEVLSTFNILQAFVGYRELLCRSRLKRQTTR